MPEAPNLLLRRTRELELPQARPELGSIFHWELLRKDGSVKQKGSMHNLILDGGLAALHDSTATHRGQNFFWLSSYLIVGTNNAAPDVTQSGVLSPIASTNSDGGFAATEGHDGAGGFIWGRLTRVFDFAAANGNLTELGSADLPHSNGSRVNWNRQLFKDELGDPVTIVKTNEEQLRVVIETRLYWPDPLLGTISMPTPGGPIDIDYEIRPYDVDDLWDFNTSGNGGFPATLGDWNNGHRTFVYWQNFTFGATPQAVGITSGSSVLNQNPSSTVYSSTHVDMNYILPAASGNFPISAAVGAGSSNANGFAIKFTPAITKTNIDRLLMTLRTSVSRHP